MDDFKEPLTVPTVAKITGRSESATYKDANEGLIGGAFRVGESIRFHHDQFFVWLESRAIKPAENQPKQEKKPKPKPKRKFGRRSSASRRLKERIDRFMAEEAGNDG